MDLQPARVTLKGGDIMATKKERKYTHCKHCGEKIPSTRQFNARCCSRERAKKAAKDKLKRGRRKGQRLTLAHVGIVANL